MSEISLRSGGPRGLRHVWRLVSRHRVPMSVLALASFVSALLEAGFLVLLTGTVIAVAAGQDALSPVMGVALPVPVALWVGGGAIVLRLALGLLSSYLSASLVTSVTVDERRRLSEGFLRAGWAVQQAEPSGRLQELMGNFVARSTFTVTAVTQAITAALSLIAFLGTGVAIDPLLTAAVVAALILLGSVLAPIRRAIRRLSGRQARSGVRFANSVAEFASLGQEMHAFGAQQHFLDRIDRLAVETAADSRKVLVAQGALTPAYTFMAYGAAMGGMAFLWVIGLGNLTAIGGVMLLMLRSLSYAQQLVTVSGHFASSIPYLEDFAKVLDRYKAGAAHRGSLTPRRVTPIQLEDVSFGYDDERTALSHVSVRINPGEIVGVIGPSGAGKSTLAQLLLGLRDPSQGRIAVHGVDLRQVDRSWWTDKVSFVPQDPVLFTGTVAENIRFFRSGISDEAMQSAAQQANVLSDIRALPQGFDTHLGERGSQLSGGQRQRLSIARALAGQPQLLIMDEPTSALDGRSEQLIRDTMARLRGHVTIIVIAHRLSTLDLCDRIMVIEGGEVTGFERPDLLHQKNPYYRRALASAGMTGPEEGSLQ